MAVFSLLTMLDDIATILDDVSLMTKVAAKKTAGVLGDDLALNAQQVSGVNPDRELPVVWAVAKGSAINKMILVPTALAISAFAPWAVTPLLMVGGLYLCYEGVEKLAHKLLHRKEEDAAHHAQELQAVADPTVDLVAFEKEKIKGAVRTDFILSAEIITIALGTVATAPILQQVLVLAGIAAIMTVGVYGLVAGIVKLDDGGLRLIKSRSGALRAFGRGILSGTPYLMKGLSIAGTAAMFMVGGSIIMHGIPVAHHAIEGVADQLGAAPTIGGLLEAITPVLLGTLGGIVAGVIALIVVTLGSKIFKLEPATSGSPGSHH